MMTKLQIIVLLLLGLQLCSGANILGVFSFPGLSHFVMFGPILKELAKRGHNVDVVSHFPLMTPIERYNDISIRGSSPIVTNNFTVENARNRPFLEGIKSLFHTIGTDTCESSFKTPQLQALRDTNKKYDVVLTELFTTDCMLGWAWNFEVPSVVITTSVNLPWSANRFGLPDNPSYIPNYFVEYGATMTLYERIINTLKLVMYKLLYYWYSAERSNSLAKDFFGEDMPDLDVLAQNTSLQLINTHFSINNVRPLVPNVIEVAGLHIQEPKPVTEHINQLLTTDQWGIVYFSMGSLILTESFPIATTQALFDAFAELPYKVVWRATKENFPKGLRFPNNIQFETWLPQLDILCDPRVKLFVSHGGLMGTQEAIYCGVPMLGIPLFGDQSLNIKQAEHMGFAIRISYDEITKDAILNAAKKLLHEKPYIENVKQISEQFKDRPMRALDAAVYCIEYVIRHKGAPKLQSMAKNLAWYQYYLVDVVAIIVGIPLIVLLLLIKLSNVLFCRAYQKPINKVKTK